MTIRVAHLIGGLFYGGGQRVVYDLLHAKKSDLEQKLWLLGDQGNTRLNSFAEAIIPYDGSYNRYKTLRNASREVRRILQNHPVDILQSHGMDADLIASMAVAKTRTKHIAHLHALPNRSSNSWNGWIRRQLYRVVTYRARTEFIAVSDAVRQENQEYYYLGKRRLTTIRNGVNVSEFSPMKSERTREKEIVFGFAGRLVEIKGLKYLLTAAKQLSEECYDFRILLAGLGNQKDYLMGLTKELHLNAKVEFLGHVENMQEFYGKIDVFVLPSLSEGLPLVVLEAMAHRVPVLATNVGGTGEVIEDGVDGWLVPSQDSNAIAAVLKSIVKTPSFQKMGLAGEEKVKKRFSMARVHSELYEHYQALLQESDLI